MKNSAQSKSKPQKKAVIYCRVSDAKQLKKGDGLNSQQTRCREFAKHKSYDVVEVFKDKGISGGLIDRPGMQQMLSYLKKHKRHTTHIVIIDDISRLARDLMAHIQLRTEINDAGGILQSPSVEFGEDSDSILVENLLASVSQHQRQKNAEQVVNRMQARFMNGYYVFCAPIGYRYKHIEGHGKMLVHDEPKASILKECLEAFACGRLDSQTEVKRFLEKHPEFLTISSRTLHLQKVRTLLERPIYAGYMDAPKWGLSLIKGKHEPLISFETFQRIQNRLNQGSKAPVRKSDRDDFLLRGFVTCGTCNSTMTGAWSKGRNAKYPYYFCMNKKCTDYRKSIRKEKLEKDFEHLLFRLRPKSHVYSLLEDILRDAWKEREENQKVQTQGLRREIVDIEKKTEQLMDRLVSTDDELLIPVYEKQLKKLRERQLLLTENCKSTSKQFADFDDIFQTALRFLENPCILWASGNPDDRKLLLRLAFEEKLPYHRNGGFRTAKTTLPFNVLEGINDNKYDLVGQVGLEPTTRPL